MNADSFVYQRAVYLNRLFRPSRQRARGVFPFVAFLNVGLLLLLFLLLESRVVLQPGIVVRLPTSSFVSGAQYGPMYGAQSAPMYTAQYGETYGAPAGPMYTSDMGPIYAQRAPVYTSMPSYGAPCATGCTWNRCPRPCTSGCKVRCPVRTYTCNTCGPFGLW